MAKIIFYTRLTLYTITLLLVSFLAVVEGFILTIAGKRLNTNYYVARSFYYIAGPLMGWKFIVEGEENLWTLKGVGVEGEAGKKGRSAVMVGNHQSFVDILYLGRIFPKHAAIMAKKSIKWIPGLGWFMMLSGTVFINRGNNKSAIASMQQAGEDMKGKRISLWIFPEGTRHSSAEDELLPFKKGAFYLAVQSGVPVVPVVCQNYHHLFDGKTRFRRGTLRIRALAPISTAGMTTADVPDLMEKTRSLMLAALKELSTSTDETRTPLLKDQRSDYETISTTAPLDGAVVGTSDTDSSVTPRGAVEESTVDDALGGKTGASRSQRKKKSIA